MLINVLVAGCVLGGVYAIVASGLSLIFGVMRVVNFAHGQFLMIGMYLVFWTNTLLGWPVYVTSVVVIPALFILGWLSEKFVVEPVIHADSSAQLLTTFGLGLGIQYIVAILWTETPRSVNVPVHTFAIGSVQFSTTDFVTMGGVIVTFLILYGILNGTKLGTMIRAVSQNPTAARLTGIKVSRINALTFGIGTALVGVAAVLLMPTYNVYPDVGSVFTVVAFITVIMGGFGSLRGAFVAAVILGVLDSVFGVYISNTLAQALTFLVFIIVLFIRPRGLFGQEARL
ncbi:branched-chain amino acid ABC transporter permease [Alicyclobacillus mengziensis]|uniref:Branched-chain amino acid ABC transporter permease n=1 Tax=Alicyclobacillus mengziensis TaxID=2931921 RepID=A0A9X7VWW2_9BACL|nr:branched-chain amino acid ABC transporter permease [Alicyclobacillus mengziensis]QSO46556.1 branched-chain amino acid ABC transporter permease [Alicyclobacillus mengziensis]